MNIGKVVTLGVSALGAYVVFKMVTDVKKDMDITQKAKKKINFTNKDRKKLIERLNVASQLDPKVGGLKQDQVKYVKRLIDTKKVVPFRIREIINTYLRANKELEKRKLEIRNTLNQIPEGTQKQNLLQEINAMVKDVQNFIEEVVANDFKGLKDNISLEEYMEGKFLERDKVQQAKQKIQQTASEANLSGYRIKKVHIPYRFLQ